MNTEFDFLRQHGFGVVYGAEEVKQKIIELGHLATEGGIQEPEGKKMNIESTTVTPVTEAGLAEAALYSFNEATGQFEDADGNAVEVTTEEAGYTQSEGDIASPADVTLN